MTRSISVFLYLVVIAMCFSTSCGPARQRSKLIDEINGAKLKARKLAEEAQRKQAKARELGDRTEHDRLINEAAQLYAQASDAFNEAANRAKAMAKVKSPEWYEEYFTLQSKLIANLARLATGAHDELIVRMNSTPTDAQLQSWKEDLNRLSKENKDLHAQISAIEKRQRMVLITE